MKSSILRAARIVASPQGAWSCVYRPRPGMEVSVPISAFEFEFGPEDAEPASEIAFSEMHYELREGRAVRLLTGSSLEGPGDRWWLLASIEKGEQSIELVPDEARELGN